MDQYERTRRLLGDAGLARLRAARVAIFGLGGVGGYALEALARAGVGALELVDHDFISLTNLNRQLLATHDTLGQSKVRAGAARVRAIDPTIAVTAREAFFLPGSAAEFDFSAYDYVVDAVDTVTAKLALALACRQSRTPIISCMGTGNKLDASALRVADIYETSVCPLARVMRRECRRHGIEALTVVYSTEPPREALLPAREQPPQGRGAIPASVSYVPAAAGLLLAGEVIKMLAGAEND